MTEAEQSFLLAIRARLERHKEELEQIHPGIHHERKLNEAVMTVADVMRLVEGVLSNSCERP